MQLWFLKISILFAQILQNLAVVMSSSPAFNPNNQRDKIRCAHDVPRSTTSPCTMHLPHFYTMHQPFPLMFTEIVTPPVGEEAHKTADGNPVSQCVFRSALAYYQTLPDVRG